MTFQFIGTIQPIIQPRREIREQIQHLQQHVRLFIIPVTKVNDNEATSNPGAETHRNLLPRTHRLPPKHLQSQRKHGR